ncbi:uncharacterized protein LOC129769876 isoform X2 [Toxorhynchites rutilus septentrionalis]|uniref:uncharacterized protein LOC129769876 isoform X2 n=1 Tax=Toxorhynchites rutilus septentrionalis TaxID=329112 RepID=UPI00247846F8|nr:uncharacterized protein LOC129769876 isoform X2 [Toxorhynchites rutilus septentrionalis]
MGKEIDPADIGKHPDLIRKAQAEMTQSDVLVCGRCHNVFHFIELFKEHKEQECRKESTLKDCRETKAKVWAFLLWKAAQLNAEDAEMGNVNSWKLYQTWVKLEESVRETWIVAGRTIQSFARMGQGNLQEMPVKITKTIIESGPDDKKAAINNSSQQSRFASGRKPDIKSNSPIAASVGKTEETKRPPLSTQVKKQETNAVNKGIGKRSVAKRTTPGSGEVVEEEVEKILAKRFNPRRKEHEYLVKWSKYAHDQNTWEPLIHLQTCQSVLEYFETQLAKQKEQRAAAAARTLQQQQAEKAKAANASSSASASPSTTSTSAVSKPATPAPTTVTIPSSAPVTVPASQLSPVTGRPIRNSKVNAMDKVKQWVGTTSGGSSGNEETGVKRKLDADSDFDAEEESDEMTSGIKKLKTENGAVNQALVKAQQSGNVKVVPVGAKSPGKVVNGIGSSKKDDSNAAEVILKTPKDGTASGVVKKPGFTGAKNVAGEAKVQIVNRGEVPKQGVFKVNQNSTSPQPSTAPVSKTTPPGTTTTTTTRIVRKNIGGTQQLVKQVVRTTIPIQHAQTPTQQRQPLQKVTSNTNSTGAPIPKVSNAVPQRNTPSSKLTAVQSKPPMNRASDLKPTASEQKINALRKQGLNVVKRVVSPAQTSAEQKSIAANDEEDDDGFNDPFPSNIAAPAPPSPPRALTLCPVTGKVLGQAEGEPTPVPSPEIQEDKSKGKKPQQQQQIQEHQQEQQDMSQEQDTQVQQILTNEDGSPIIVAGEDGTLYQVAGKNAEGQTILIAQGADGEQQCVLVASQDGEGEDGAGGVLTLDAAVSEAVAQIGVPQEGQQLTEEQGVQYKIEENADPNQQLTIQTEDSQDGQITAEVVQADQPSPGGTRRVVLLLPDGSFMMTEVNEEQYQSLNLVN